LKVVRPWSRGPPRHTLEVSPGRGRSGTGDVRVQATSTLDATLSGTGSILYTGSPAVTTHNTGVGSVTAA